MATVCVTVPETEAARIAAAVAYRDGIEITTPQEGVDAVQRHVMRYLGQLTIQHEAQQAAQAVLNNVNDPLVASAITQMDEN